MANIPNIFWVSIYRVVLQHPIADISYIVGVNTRCWGTVQQTKFRVSHPHSPTPYTHTHTHTHTHRGFEQGCESITGVNGKTRTFPENTEITTETEVNNAEAKVSSGDNINCICLFLATRKKMISNVNSQ